MPTESVEWLATAASNEEELLFVTPPHWVGDCDGLGDNTGLLLLLFDELEVVSVADAEIGVLSMLCLCLFILCNFKYSSLKNSFLQRSQATELFLRPMVGFFSPF